MNKRKRTIITGVSGQDGSYLAELLVSKGYEVYGFVPHNEMKEPEKYFWRLNNIINDIELIDVDLLDYTQIAYLMDKIKPVEIYHLAAQSAVASSFENEFNTLELNIKSTHNILVAIKAIPKNTRLFFAATGEIYGREGGCANEVTPLSPRNLYAISKATGYWLVKYYREGYGIFACNGILFNHESPRRGEIFVTRKITRAVANILAGKQKKLYIGNMDAKRDWGYAPEYVYMMWLMLQQDKPDDYVVGTGESRTVREFIEQAFGYSGVEIEWRGEGVEEKGIIKSVEGRWAGVLKEGEEIIEVDPRYFRPTEVDYLLADITKAREVLGWEPKVKFEELVKIMVDYDMQMAGLEPKGEGIKISKEKGYEYIES